jgi:hypothetical protein
MALEQYWQFNLLGSAVWVLYLPLYREHEAENRMIYE